MTPLSTIGCVNAKQRAMQALGTSQYTAATEIRHKSVQLSQGTGHWLAVHCLLLTLSPWHRVHYAYSRCVNQMGSVNVYVSYSLRLS